MRDSLKRLFSRSNTTSASHHVVVGVGSETFGVPASQIHEIICLGDMETMPRLPKSLSGPVRILNKLVCLVKLQIPFLRAPADFELSPRTCILVLKAHSTISSKIRAGVVVDRVDRILDLEEHDVETFTTRRRGPWSACTLGFTGRQLPVVLLDLERFLAPESASAGAGSSNPETATARLRRRNSE